MEVDDLLLFHADVPYDAAKRREYYLRTRQLKGRNPAAAKPAIAPKAPSGQDRLHAFFVSINQKESNRRKAEFDARIKSLNGKLIQLRQILKDLKAQIEKTSKNPAVKNQSGKTTTPKDSSGTKTDSNKNRKELTPAQKKKAADEAQKRREKETGKKSPDQSIKEITQQIAEVQKQIRAAIERLHKASVKNASPGKPMA